MYFNAYVLTNATISPIPVCHCETARWDADAMASAGREPRGLAAAKRTSALKALKAAIGVTTVVNTRRSHAYRDMKRERNEEEGKESA